MSLAFIGKMDTHKLKAQKRIVFGRKVNALRKEGLLPANIYGKNIKSLAVQINLDDFVPVYKEAGEAGVINLMINGKGKGEELSVLVANLQKDPTRDFPLHVDFRKVDLKEKIMASVPIEFKGEAPCEKTSVGTVVQYIDEVEVEALPTDLPEKFEIDISVLTDVDQAIFLKDLKYEKSKISLKDDFEKIVAKVEPPQRVEEEPAPVAEEAAPGVGEVPAGETEGEEAVAAQPKDTQEATSKTQ